MAVYIDKARNKFGRMIADTLIELHDMADHLNLRRSWFQPWSSPHYDLSLFRREKAIKLGAIILGRREFVAKLREIRSGDF